MKYLVYRDLKRDGFNNHYELCNYEKSKDMKVIKEQIIKGEFGYPDMYIRHLSVTFKNKTYPIISYTDYELTPNKGFEILANCVELLRTV